MPLASPAANHVEARAAAPKAQLVILHGLAEYAARYRAIAEEFAARGITTYAFDQLGHGSSLETRTHVDAFDRFVSDAQLICREIKARHPELPLFVWGHSMGAIVALRLAVNDPAALAGLIVSSNSLDVFRRGLNPLNPFFRLASRLAPHVRVPLGLDARKISQDEAVQRDYATDPQIPKTASLRLIVEFAKACELARRDLQAIRLPLLIVHGEADAIAPASGSKLLFDAAGASDKRLEIFPGLRHEVHNERADERARFVQLLIDWVMTRASS